MTPKGHDRCWGGTLHSSERLYLDHLWQGLGVDPHDDLVAAIEGRLVAATLRDHHSRILDMRRQSGQ